MPPLLGSLLSHHSQQLREGSKTALTSCLSPSRRLPLLPWRRRAPLFLSVSTRWLA